MPVCEVRRTCRVLVIVSIGFGMAACGGGGGGGATTTPPRVQAPSDTTSGTTTTLNSSMADDALALVETYVPGGSPNFTSIASVPTSGSATFEGHYYGVVASEDLALIGEMTLNVAFGANSATISGSVTGFEDGEGEAVAGTLAIGSGSLNRSGNPDLDATVTASATGTLTQGSESVELGTELEGDFLGSGAEAIGGAVVGVATFGSTRRDFDGGFIAAQ